MNFRQTQYLNQGLLLFWGGLSLLFATGACYFYWQDETHEREARILRDQYHLFQQENDRLKAEVERLQEESVRATGLLRNSQETIQESRRTLDEAASEKEQLLAQQKMLIDKQKRVAAAEQEQEAAVRTALGDTDVIITTPPGALVIGISNRNLFAGVEPDLKDGSGALLKKILQALTPDWSLQQLGVEGHTDNDPPSNALKSLYPTNGELSAARATAVARYLIDTLKAPREKVVPVGRGDSHPVASNEDDAGRAKNRRVELVLTPFPSLKEDPATAPTPPPPPAHP